MKKYYITSAVALVLGLALIASVFPLSEIASPSDAENSLSSLIYRYRNQLEIINLTLGVAVALAGLFCLIFRKTVQGSCSLKTSALSLALSFATSLGLYCGVQFMLSAPKENPITFPVSVLLMVLCLAGFVMMFCLYIMERLKKQSVKGIAIDVLFAGMYLLPMFMMYDVAYRVVSSWV